MRRALLVWLLCLFPLGCAPGPEPPQASAFGPGDPVIAALNQAQQAFADPSRTYGKPADAARAAAGIDYVADAIPTDPRLMNLPPDTKRLLAEAQTEVRSTLGIASGAPSSLVVERLLATAAALDRGDQGAALVELGPLSASGTGEQMLSRLANLPYMQAANASTRAAAEELSTLENEIPFPQNDMRFPSVIVP